MQGKPRAGNEACIRRHKRPMRYLASTGTSVNDDYYYCYYFHYGRAMSAGPLAMFSSCRLRLKGLDGICQKQYYNICDFFVVLL